MTSKISEIFVEGMTCQACVRRVTRAIERLDGVRGVQVDLASGHVAVDHEEACKLETVAQAIRQSGYQVGGTGAAS